MIYINLGSALKIIINILRKGHSQGVNLITGKIYRTLKKSGVKGIKEKIKRKFHQRYYVYRSELKPHEIKYEAFHFVPMDEMLLQEIYMEFKDEIPDEKYRILKDRIRPESTDLCYAVLDDESRIYGHYCISRGDNYEPVIDLVISANEEELYLFDDYTFIKRRGRKAQYYSILKRQEIAREMGYKAAQSIILRGNTASERAYISAGFYRIKKIDSFKVGQYKRKLIRKL